MDNFLQFEKLDSANDEVIYASIARRFVAFAIDLFVICVILLIPTALVVNYIEQELRKAGSIYSQDGGFIFFTIALIIFWLYYAIMESSRLNGTLGKILVGIKLLDENKHGVKFFQSTGRFLLKFGMPVILIIILTLIPFPLLTIIVGLYLGWLLLKAKADPKKQGFYDKAVRTVVLRK